jgi:hypothetical protein
MKRLVIALALCAAGAGGAAAQDEKGPFGLGLIIGSPTGVSVKYYLGQGNMAVDGAVGGALAGNNGISVHADVLWHPSMLTRESAFDLTWYFGAGIRVLDHDRGNDGNDDFHFGPRVPVGLLFDFNEVSIDVFLEAAAIIDFRTGGDTGDHDGLGFDLNAGIGVRYYF